MVPKWLQNGTQNASKLVLKSSLGRVLGVSCCKLFFVPFFPPFFPPLGGILERTWAPSWSQVGSKLGQVGASWGQDAPCCPLLVQVGDKVAQVGAKMEPTWASRGTVWRFQEIFKFVSIFEPMLDRFFMIF